MPGVSHDQDSVPASICSSLIYYFFFKKARSAVCALRVLLLPACPWEHFDACLLSAACLPFGTLRCLLALGQLGSILAPYTVPLNLLRRFRPVNRLCIGVRTLIGLALAHPARWLLN